VYLPAAAIVIYVLVGMLARDQFALFLQVLGGVD
jgi:hypothetical protein